MTFRPFDSILGRGSSRASAAPRVLGAAIVALMLSVGGETAAVRAQEMPSPTIAVLDIQRILRDSKAAKSIRPQVEKRKKQFQEEVRGQEGKLRKADKDLQQQRAILAPEAYAKKRRAFEENARKARRSVQARKRQLEVAFGKAMEEVRRSLILIARDVAIERKINIVLPKSVVLLSMKNLDITAEALKRLDEKLPSVKVTIAEPK